MNKRVRTFFMMVIGMLLIASCGQGKGAGSAASPSSSAVSASAQSGSTAQASGSPAGSPGEASPSAEATPAPRIIATTVAVTQITDALGIDLIGIPTSSKTLPERYKGVKKVGNPMSPDMELVKSLQPTEVLSVTTLKYDLQPKFDTAGVQASFLDLTSLSRMEEAIGTLGKKYGKEAEATALNAKYEAKAAEVRAATQGKPSPKVLILMGVPGSYLVATEHSYIGDLVKLAGGTNVVQGEKVEYLASNTEYLQKSNPDVILRAAHGMPEEVIKMFDLAFKQNDIWKHFDAVKNGRVYDLDETLFGTTASLGADQALDELIGMLYP